MLQAVQANPKGLRRPEVVVLNPLFKKPGAGAGWLCAMGNASAGKAEERPADAARGYFNGALAVVGDGQAVARAAWAVRRGLNRRDRRSQAIRVRPVREMHADK